MPAPSHPPKASSRCLLPPTLPTATLQRPARCLRSEADVLPILATARGCDYGQTHVMRPWPFRDHPEGTGAPVDSSAIAGPSSARRDTIGGRALVSLGPRKRCCGSTGALAHSRRRSQCRGRGPAEDADATTRALLRTFERVAPETDRSRSDRVVRHSSGHARGAAVAVPQPVSWPGTDGERGRDNWCAVAHP